MSSNNKMTDVSNMSFFALQKSRFFSPNCPEAAKNAVIRGFRKTKKRFSNA
jgi:hypothetical protein